MNSIFNKILDMRNLLQIYKNKKFIKINEYF